MSEELDRRARKPGLIMMKPANDKYRESWERIFGKKETTSADNKD